MVKKQCTPIDWSQFDTDNDEYVMDTNINYFIAEIPIDERKLYSCNETISIDRRV